MNWLLPLVITIVYICLFFPTNMHHIGLLVTIFGLISLCLIGIALFELIKYSRSDASQIFTILILSIISVALWIIFTYTQLDIFTSQDNLRMYMIFAALSNISILVGLVFITIFVQYLTKTEPDKLILTIEFVLLSLLIAVYVSQIIVGFSENTRTVPLTLNIANIINLVMLVLVLYTSVNDMQRFLKYDLNKKLRSQVISFRNSLIIGFGGAIPIISMAAIYNQSYIGFGYIVISTSMFYMVKAFYKAD